MKIIFSNFLITLSRFRVSSVLNIFGISIAFAAFMIIMMQVNYERTFDKNYTSEGKIYRVHYGDSSNYDIIFPRPLFDLIADALPSQVKAVSLSENGDGYEIYLNIEQPDGTSRRFKESMGAVTPGIIDVFGFKIIEGAADLFKEPGKVMMPRSMASKIFGKESAVGRTFTDVGDTVRYEIGAVYEDFPVNTSVKNNIYRKFSETGDGKNNWSDQSFNVYFLLDSDADPQAIANLLPVAKDKFYWDGFNYKLCALDELYYVTGIDFDTLPKGNREATNSMLIIAILIIVIAVINFINFSTSLAPLRIKAINTHKILGCSQSLLRTSIVLEAVGLCVIAFGLALVWVYIFNITGLSSLLSTSADIVTNANIVLGTFLLCVVAGLVAGIYPSLYMTSFQPAMIIKGAFGLSISGRRLRTALIGFQFVVSIALIIAAIFLHLQNNYIRNYNSGFNKDQLVIVDVSEEIEGAQNEIFVNELKSNPLIEDVAFCDSRIGASDIFSKWGGKTPANEHVSFHVIRVSKNLPKVIGLTIEDGVDLSTINQDAFLFNETAMLQHGFEVGNTYQNISIVGVVNDFNYSTLRNTIMPLGLLYSANKRSFLNVGYIKTVGDPYAAVEHIKKIFAKIDPQYPVEISFFDTLFNDIYQKEQKTTKLVTLFSILAVVISLFGVFGLIMFETQYRRKEIGVRKVFGATIGEILTMFNRNFLRIIIVCFVVAVPIAYLGVTSWLNGFAYRTPIHWWVFGVSLMIVVFITLLTVTIQSWRSATANPVDSLKSE